MSFGRLGAMGRGFGKMGARSGGYPAWIPNPTNKPDIAVNWMTNQAWTKTGGLMTPATLGITTSRASVKQVVDSNGNWSQVASNTTAQSNLGRSTEEARTNSIRNNTMVGAVAGSPGTLPTNWTAIFTNAAGTLATSVIGTGTEGGIDYIDIRLFGTPAAGGGQCEINFDTGGSVLATQGQTWANSVFVKIVGGDVTNAAPQLGLRERGGAGLLQDDISSTLTVAASAAALGNSRQSFRFTLANNATTNIYPSICLNYTTTAAIDITLRIGWPQLENNSINSTVASATVAAGGASGVSGTAVYSVGGGSGTAATLNVTVSGGAITAINSVASAGSYTVFPPSPAALTYVSGTGSGVVGATVNLTPTNLAANAFATSPIKTTAGAATRAADNTTLTGLTFGSAYTLFEQATPQASATYGSNQFALQLDDGTNNNKFVLARNTTTGNAVVFSSTGGVTTTDSSGVSWAQNASGKLASSTVAGAQSSSFNGGTAFTSAVANPVSVANVRFGSNSAAVLSFDGLAAIDAIWLTQAVPSAQLVTMTT